MTFSLSKEDKRAEASEDRATYFLRLFFGLIRMVLNESRMMAVVVAVVVDAPVDLDLPRRGYNRSPGGVIRSCVVVDASVDIDIHFIPVMSTGM